ncbi:MAG: hypothetical protein HOK49_12440 [Opitutae bacterium]|nr:hypothetical protein [Opitutae bacterium]
MIVSSSEWSTSPLHPTISRATNRANNVAFISQTLTAPRRRSSLQGFFSEESAWVRRLLRVTADRGGCRRDGDIEAVFPNAEPIHTPHRDYLYRANLPHEEVARAIRDETLSIDYTNFKGSVDDMERHDEYLDVWMVMRQGQLNRTGVEEL